MRPGVVPLALALMACKTDVSDPTGFGTQGQVVTGAPAGVVGIAAGYEGVLWTNGASIEYCPRQGCAAWTSVYTTSGGIARMVADDANVYWTEVFDVTTDAGSTPEATVWWCPQTGCTPDQGAIYVAEPGTIADPTNTPPDYGFLALDGGNLYWSVVRSSVLFLETCQVPGCSGYASYSVDPSVAPGLLPRLVHDGVLYATQKSGNGISALVSCPASAPAGGGAIVCSAPTTVAGGIFDVHAAVIEGATLYFDAYVAGTEQESVYSCPLPCTTPTPLFPSIWPGFAVQGGNLFTAARSPSGTTGFANCVVSSCSPSGPQLLDLPFDFVQFDQLVPAPSIVPDAHGAGAYAYALYDIPNDGVGLTPGISAIVYLPNPTP